MTRDEVIKALECRLDIDDSRFKRCLSCPYRQNVDHGEWICNTDDIMRDTVALLKEEPRPLSLEDILHIYHTLGDHVWPYNTPPYLWCEVNRKMYDAFSGWVTWREVMSIIERVVTLRPYSIDNYGGLWTLYMKCPDKKSEEKEDTNCET